MIPAIVLAAGASSRMGRAKALLPLPNGRCFLTQIDAVLREAGVVDLVAVLGFGAAAIRRVLESGPCEANTAARPLSGRPIRLVENPDPSRGQLSSLLVGLDAVNQLPGAPAEAVMVTTVDLPLVSADSVRRLLAAWHSTRAPIVRPVCGDRHGHPAIFSRALFAELRAADPARGARVVLEAHAADAVEVRLEDRGAFDDIDTPEDYERAFGRSLR